MVVSTWLSDVTFLFSFRFAEVPIHQVRRRVNFSEGLCNPHEGWAEGYLLHHRRISQGRRELSFLGEAEKERP
jgi:hypothetical protein